MTLSSRFAILWLDDHISLPTECKQLKSLFQVDLAPAAVASPVDPIDQLICCIREFGAPVSFVSTIERALEEIESLASDGTKIIFITSGTLGKTIMPRIQERGLAVYWYYIFCGNIASHVDWATPYLSDGIELQMFDFEMTLLIRLSRDLSKELIEEGKRLLSSDACSALRYFECARALAETAMERDTPKDPAKDPHRPSTTHRTILDGENGLIAQARRACIASSS